jgi:predicted small lipoprotein YifL
LYGATILRRMKTFRTATAALVLVCLVLLAACGNKGDLVLPDKPDQADQPAAG